MLVDKDHQGLVCDGLCVAVVDNVVLTDVLTKHHLLAGRNKIKPAERNEHSREREGCGSLQCSQGQQQNMYILQPAQALIAHHNSPWAVASSYSTAYGVPAGLHM